jgi:hypothetical protein
MTLQPNTFEYNLLFYLTIILIIVKVLLSTYLGIKVLKKRKQEQEIEFLFAFFILLLSGVISRIIYFYFDFFLTQNNPDNYVENVIYWKIASAIGICGSAVVMFAVDRKVLKFKLKGIFSYILIATAVIVLIYPVNTVADFNTVANIIVLSFLAIILLPAVFFYVGVKIHPSPRALSAFAIAIGIIVYMIGTIMVNETFFGFIDTAIRFLLFVILKIAGLAMMSYGVTKLYE